MYVYFLQFSIIYIIERSLIKKQDVKFKYWILWQYLLIHTRYSHVINEKFVKLIY